MVHGKVAVTKSPQTQCGMITKLRKKIQYLVRITKVILGTSIMSVMKMPEEGNKQLLTKAMISKNVPEEKAWALSH